MVFFKKVDAIQLKLTDSELADLKAGHPVCFLTGKVKEYGPSYFCLLQSGENQVKVQEGQWVVRHPDGYYEILWPDQFTKNFNQSGNLEDPVNLANDPFLKKSYNQPTVIA